MKYVATNLLLYLEWINKIVRVYFESMKFYLFQSTYGHRNRTEKQKQ